MEEISRVPIESLAQWNAIKADLMQAALAEMDVRIKADGLEAEREAMMEHMREQVLATCEIVQMNIRVNGTNYEDLKLTEEDNMEPFDEDLDLEESLLSSERLEWEKTVVEQRLNRPAELVTGFEAALDESLRADAELDVEADEKAEAEEKAAREEGEREDPEEVADPDLDYEDLPVQLERARNYKAVEAEVMSLNP